MRIRELLAASAAAALSVSPSIAAATTTTVGPVSTTLFASGDGPQNATYGILKNTGSVTGGSTTSFASISYSGGSMSLASDATSVGGPLEGSSESEGSFDFEVLGPAGMVPMDFSATGTTKVTGPGGLADADFNISGTTAKLVACSSSTASDCTGLPSLFSGAVSFDVQANQVYTVNLDAHCLAASSLVEGTTCSATLDPMVTVNPSFVDKGLYSLIVSPNVAGVVPEPASWAVMLIGLFGIGALCRRGRIVRGRMESRSRWSAASWVHP